MRCNDLQVRTIIEQCCNYSKYDRIRTIQKPRLPYQKQGPMGRKHPLRRIIAVVGIHQNQGENAVVAR